MAVGLCTSAAARAFAAVEALMGTSVDVFERESGERHARWPSPSQTNPHERVDRTSH